LTDLSKELNVDVSLLTMSKRVSYMNVLQAWSGEVTTEIDDSIDVFWDLSCQNVSQSINIL